MSISNPKRLFFYSELRETFDQLMIAHVITGVDVSAKIHLLANPHLSADQLRYLATDRNPDVRCWVAKVRNLPADVLRDLQGDEVEAVQAYALSNHDSNPELLWAVVMEGRFSASSWKVFSRSVHAVGNFEVFRKLWNVALGGQQSLVKVLDRAMWENSPIIDIRVIAFVHEEVITGRGSNQAREAYAYCEKLALPKVLDSLKDDAYRPVLRALVYSALVWPSTHVYMAEKYKSPSLRLLLARYSDDNVVLNKIYAGTRSENIRNRVLDNPAFVLLS